MKLAFALLLLLPAVAAAQEPAPTLDGKWSGTWTSDKNGHSGPLNARLRELPDGSYRAWFTGRFFVLIPFVYTTKFQAAPIGPDALGVSASQNLGPGLGTFDTNGIATSNVFDARFTAKGDSGRFFMTRRR